MSAALLVCGALTALVLAYVWVHARLTAGEYELGRLTRERDREVARQSRLAVAVAEATAPARIRAQAEEMGLVPYHASDALQVVATPHPAAGAGRDGAAERPGTRAAKEVAPDGSARK
jgi:hypothetical protein